MGIDFTERRHVLFSRVVESLLCSLHERPVSPVQTLSARIAVRLNVSNTKTLIKDAISVDVQA